MKHKHIHVHGSHATSRGDFYVCNNKKCSLAYSYIIKYIINDINDHYYNRNTWFYIRKVTALNIIRSVLFEVLNKKYYNMSSGN